jgi:hypothetical protein
VDLLSSSDMYVAVLLILSRVKESIDGV